MENNKYYTPDISDIRIGYECEWVDTRGDWVPCTVECPQDIVDAFNDKLRTLYLIKKQIENEGWIHKATMLLADFSKENNDILRESFEKNNYLLILNSYPNKRTISIMIKDPIKITWELGIQPEKFAFNAECPSINEFRYITKNLLKI